MKSLVGVLFLSVCAMAQTSTPAATCGPQDVAFVAFKVTKDKSPHPASPPENGKALVYWFGWGALAVDGKPVGSVAQSYAVMEVDPGEHHFCAWGPSLPGLGFKHPSLHSLDAKPGETYYFDLDTATRFVFALNLVDPDEGKYRIATLPFSTSQPK